MKRLKSRLVGAFLIVVLLPVIPLSVVMWSLENEILHCGAGGKDCDVEKYLAELGRHVKQLDPTHLITYEADMIRVRSPM